MDRLSLDSRWANGTRGRSLKHPSSRRCVGIRWEGVSLIDGDGIGGVVDGREEDKTMQKETARGQEWVRKGRRSVFPGVGGLTWDLSAKPGVSHSQRRPPIFHPPPAFWGGTVGDRPAQPRRARCPVALRGMRQTGRLRSSSRSAAHLRNRGRAQTHRSSSSSPTREGRGMVWTLRRPIRLLTRASIQSHSPQSHPSSGFAVSMH